MSETEPNTKAWIRMEERVFSRNIVVCLTRDYGEILPDDKSKKEIAIIADIVEAELTARVNKFTKGISKAPTKPPIAPKTSSKAPDKAEEEVETPTKECSKCGQTLKGKPDKFKVGEFYFWCMKCERYERD